MTNKFSCLKKFITLACYFLLSIPIIAQSNSWYLDHTTLAIQIRQLIDDQFKNQKLKLVLVPGKEPKNETFDIKETNLALTISDSDILFIKLLDIYKKYDASKSPNVKQGSNDGKVLPTGGIPQPGNSAHGPSLSDELIDNNLDDVKTNYDSTNIENDLKNELITIYLLTDNTSVSLNQNLQHFHNVSQNSAAATRLKAALIENGKIYPTTIPQANSLNLASGFAFNEATIIYGITDWVIKSAKQEILESVLEGYYDKLHNNNITNTLLSHTLQTFNQFREDNTVNLAKYGDLWKASFQQDLSSIPVSLSNETFVGAIIDSIAPASPIKNEMVPLISGGTKIVYGIYEKKHPVNIIAELATNYSTEANSINELLPFFKRAILMANVVTDVTGSLEDNVYKTVSLSALKDMTTAQWTALLRLIYLKNRVFLTLALNQDPINLLGEVKSGPNAKFYNLLVATASSYQAIQEILSNHVNPISDGNTAKSVSDEELKKVMSIAGAIVKNVLPVISSFLPPNVAAQSVVYNWDGIANSIVQIGQGVSSKQYGTALSGTLQLLAFADQTFSGNHPRLNEILQSFTRYGSFMVNILAAKTSEDIQGALDELIPKNQYKLKNICYSSFSVSAYPGVFAGKETIRKYNTSGTSLLNTTYKSTSNNLSFYLPIGFDFSVGSAGGKSCWILFVQAIDLGAVLNYRLSNSDSTEGNNPNISFQQLLSPGASIMHQFRNTPIVAGLGVNYTPALRKIQQNGNTYNGNAMRYGLFVAIDVTAFHIRISKRKYSSQ